MKLSVIISSQAIDIHNEVAELQAASPAAGALVTFTGLVRDEAGKVNQLLLEHYPGMTEKTINGIITEAGERWILNAVRVVHRVGSLNVGELIVFVGVASAHRADAFAACEFIMDFLKTRAPFWKKEAGSHGERWIEQRQSDLDREGRWHRE